MILEGVFKEGFILMGQVIIRTEVGFSKDSKEASQEIEKLIGKKVRVLVEVAEGQ